MGRNLTTGVIAILLGTGYLVLAFRLRAGALADAVGPAGLPRIFGFVMVALGVILCIQALAFGRSRAAATPEGALQTAENLEADGEGGSSSSDLTGLARAAGLLAIGILYLLIIKTVGYIVAIAVLIVTAAIYGGAKLSWRVFAIGIGGAVVFWLLFVEILGIPLPPGVLAGLL